MHDSICCQNPSSIGHTEAQHISCFSHCHGQITDKKEFKEERHFGREDMAPGREGMLAGARAQLATLYLNAGSRR